MRESTGGALVASDPGRSPRLLSRPKKFEIVITARKPTWIFPVASPSPTSPSLSSRRVALVAPLYNEEAVLPEFIGRFGLDSGIIAKVLKLHVVVSEVGISCYGRTPKEGKKIGRRDGFRALYAIFKYNFRRQ